MKFYQIVSSYFFKNFLPSKEGMKLARDIQQSIRQSDFIRANDIANRISSHDKQNKIIHGIILSIRHHENKKNDDEKIREKYDLKKNP